VLGWADRPAIDLLANVARPPQGAVAKSAWPARPRAGRRLAPQGGHHATAPASFPPGWLLALLWRRAAGRVDLAVQPRRPGRAPGAPRPRL